MHYKHAKSTALTTTPTFMCHKTMQQRNINQGDYMQVSEYLSLGENCIVEHGLLLTHKMIARRESSW